MERLLKKAGCKRISVEAAEKLREILEKQGISIGKMSWKLAKHAKRRTVMQEDVKLASQAKQN